MRASNFFLFSGQPGSLREGKNRDRGKRGGAAEKREGPIRGRLALHDVRKICEAIIKSRCLLLLLLLSLKMKILKISLLPLQNEGVCINQSGLRTTRRQGNKYHRWPLLATNIHQLNVNGRCQRKNNDTQRLHWLPGDDQSVVHPGAGAVEKSKNSNSGSELMDFLLKPGGKVAKTHRLTCTKLSYLEWHAIIQEGGIKLQHPSPGALYQK